MSTGPICDKTCPAYITHEFKDCEYGAIRAYLEKKYDQGSKGKKMIRWWKYAVMRGKDLPVSIEGVWYEIEDIESNVSPEIHLGVFTFEATHEWEQREDGEVAVVYRPTFRMRNGF